MITGLTTPTPTDLDHAANVEFVLNNTGTNYDILFAGRTITRDFTTLTGTTFTTMEDVFFPAEPPTASLTLTYDGSTTGANRTLEISSAGTLPATANWTAGRQATTGLITSIDVEGNNQTFTQPNQGATTNGTQALTITNNTNITIDLTVNSESGNATDAISLTWLWKRYWGLDSDGTLNDAEILALSNELSGSRAKTFVVNPTNERVVFVYEASLGDLTSIRVNDFESILAFTKVVQSHTNASGATTDFNLYISNNAFNVQSTIVTQ